MNTERAAGGRRSSRRTARSLVAIVGALAVCMGLTLVVAGPASANVTAPASGAVLRGNATLSDSGGYDDSALGVCSGSGSTTIQLVNSSGGVVFSQHWSSGGSRSVTIDTHDHANGSYTVRGYDYILYRKHWYSTSCSTKTETSSRSVTIQNITGLTSGGATSAPTGTGVAVTATLTDPNKSPEGVAGKTITFSLSGGSSVSATTNSGGVASATLPVTGTPRNATLTIAFAGDSHYVGKTITKGFAVEKDTTSTSLDPTTDVVHGQAVSFVAHVAATQGTGTPAGTVQFTVDGHPYGGPVALVAGTAGSQSSTQLSTGPHTIGAEYSGNTTYLPSTAGTRTQTVAKAATSTSLASNANPTTHGQSVTFTATVDVVAPGAGAPTGSVQFNVDGQPRGTAIPLDGDHAELTISNLHAGNHDVDATYNGDGDFAGSSSGTVTQGVNRAETTVALTPSDPDAVSGEPLTYSAQITPVGPGAGSPTGTVQFFADGAPMGDPVPLASNGTATSPEVKLGFGTHAITANYGGDTDFAGSTAAYDQSVAPAHTTTTLSLTPNPSVFGQEVTFRAEVAAQAPGTGHPTGAVRFSIDGTVASSYVTLDAGAAEFAVSDLAPGSHTITASYLSDDENFVPSHSDAAEQTVRKASTRTTIESSASPSVFGQPVTFTAHVAVVSPGAGDPSGTVMFFDGTDEIATAAVDSSTAEQASITVSDLSVAAHAISATYSGDDDFSGSTGSVSQTVKRGESSLVVGSSANPAQSGQSIRFSATVSPVAPAAGDPSGTVSFTINGVPFGSDVDLVDGTATSSSFIALTPGTYTVAASYSGDGNFRASSGSLDQGLGQGVAKGSTTMVVSTDGSPASYGDPVTFTADVDAVAPATGSPSGVVQFWEGDHLLGSSGLTASGLTSSSATFATASLAPGDHSITAVYVGNFNFEGSTAAVAQTIRSAPTLTGLSAATDPITFGDSATLTATVAATLPASTAPSGEVRFEEDGAVIGTAPLVAVDGHREASITVSDWHAGSHAVTAVYSGDGTFAASTSASWTEHVQRAQSTTTAATLITSSSDGVSIDIGRLRATVRGLDGVALPGETVQFSTTNAVSGAAVPVCTAVTDADGTAACDSTVVDIVNELLTNGYDASFVGDVDYLPSTGHGRQG